MNDSIGQKLKILRKGRKLTQQEIADRLGMSRATVSNYEIGRRTPNLSDLKRFAEYYGVSLDYFGVASSDDLFEIVSRARQVFESEEVSAEDKRGVYEEIMKLYLNIK